MPTMTQKAREAAADLNYARIAKRYGMQNSLRAFWEARAAGVTPALAMALLEQESTTGANVFGHDNVVFPQAWKGAKVTKAKYLKYRQMRRDGKWGMQGVGPLQLTYWTIQDSADRLGGCWVPKYNLRQGYRTLAANIKAYGTWTGVERYNGTGPAAVRYRESVKIKHDKWHRRLHGR